jgi:hypothetical protein
MDSFARSTGSAISRSLLNPLVDFFHESLARKPLIPNIVKIRLMTCRFSLRLNVR